VAPKADKETGIQVIARAGEILRLLAKSERGMPLRSLATATGLPRSTVHRIVVALAAENLVVWDPNRGLAELGLGLMSLALSRRQRLRDAVRPHLEALVRRVDETADLVVLRGESVVFVDQVMAHQILVVSVVGAVQCTGSTACGKALLAALPPEDAERILPQELEAFTPHTVTDRTRILEELALIRSSRLAFDRDEHTVGVSAVGSVVRNAWGEVAAITVPVPTQRFAGREEVLAEALLETCDRVDDALLHV
jgi:DNA-binding IclR family transcriptional regulator